MLSWDQNEAPVGDDPDWAHVTVDIRSAVDVAVAAKTSAARFGRVDLCVNAAGRLLRGNLADVSSSQIHELFAVNVVGTSLVTQALVPALALSQGSIVNVASSVAGRATLTNAHYAASKAALVQLTRSWARELGAQGIRVNAVGPRGPHRVVRHRRNVDGDADAFFAARAADRVVARAGTAAEIAVWIARLGAPDGWITGQHLIIDGGAAL